MALLHSLSSAAVNTSLDLFNIEQTDVSLSDQFFLNYYPIADLSTNTFTPIEFSCTASDSFYVDLSKTRIFVKIKITKGTETLKFTSTSDADLKDPQKSDIVAPINNIIHSLFSNIEVYIQDLLVSQPATNNYPYISYLNKILNNSSLVLNNKNSEAGFYWDTKPDSALESTGFMKRLKLTSNSTEVELSDTLSLDFFQSTKLLLNQIPIRFRFNRSNPAFCLQTHKTSTESNYRVEILSMKLQLFKILPDVSILSAHDKLLSQMPALYEYERLLLRHYNIPINSSTHVLENLFNGILPQKIFFMMVDTTEFVGDFKSNPFNFQPKNISHVALYADQKPLLDLDLDFSNSQYLESFSNLFFHLGYANQNKGNLHINRENFKDGYCIFVYDLSATLGMGKHLNLQKTGNLRLSLTFGSPLTKSTTLLVIGSFQNVLSVDKERRVLHDFKI